MKRTTKVACAGYVCLLGPAIACGSPGSDIGEDAAAGVDECEACELTLIPVATLGSASDPASPAGTIMGRVVRRENGNLYAIATGNSQLLVYSPTGEFIRTLGRPGEGPGEFSTIRWLTVMRGDSLAVSGMARQMTIFTPDDSIARTAHVPVVPESGLVPLTDGRVLVAGRVRSPRDRMLLPIHTVRADGTLGPSFGLSNPVVDSAQPSRYARVIAPSSAGGIWSARKTQYVVERFDAEGNVLESLERTVDWFPRRETLRAPDGEPPATFVTALAENSAGNLVVLLLVADTNWRREYSQYEPETPITRSMMNREYDSVVEILDPRTGMA